MDFNRKANRILFSILTGMLLWSAWPARGFALFLFLAWIPLLFLEDFFYNNQKIYKPKKLFWLSYLAFFTWNLLSTWWVYNSSAFGVAAAVFCNSLFMALVFMLFHFTRCRAGNIFGYISLPIYWISFEYLHLHWDLSWPWLTLGNGFSYYYKWVQWYEYTGVFGGSLWILIVNVILFQHISAKKQISNLWVALLIIIIPISFSLYCYHNYSEKYHPVNIAVIQPNIDPYNEKFSGMSSEEQLTKLLRLSSTVVDSSTQYMVAPETALPNGIWEEDLKIHPDIQLLRKFMKAFPNLTVVIGAATNRFYEEDQSHSVTARKFKKSPGYYDSYNTALQLDNFSDSIQTYHKSKLVPGVEKMPYPVVFGFLEKFAIDLGGMSGSLGTETEPKIFTAHDSIKIAPIICYESVYGDYISEYVKKGAQLLFIITNDGWWGETPGHRQHLQYGRLRAIEMRRCIARSANTGISCFINQRGDILQPTKWWNDDVIKAELNANDELTFYARHENVISLTAVFLSVIFIFTSFYKRFPQR